MARHEADREDLFAEATGLVRRLEARRPESAAAIVAGFRADGVLVVYLNADAMLQLDAAGRLRRAYLNGCLYRAQGPTLCRLVRSRSDTETVLERHDLSPVELADFRETLRVLLQPLMSDLDASRLDVLRRQPPTDLRLESEIAERLQRAATATDWIAPPFPGKR